MYPGLELRESGGKPKKWVQGSWVGGWPWALRVASTPALGRARCLRPVWELGYLLSFSKGSKCEALWDNGLLSIGGWPGLGPVREGGCSSLTPPGQGLHSLKASARLQVKAGDKARSGREGEQQRKGLTSLGRKREEEVEEATMGRERGKVTAQWPWSEGRRLLCRGPHRNLTQPGDSMWGQRGCPRPPQLCSLPSACLDGSGVGHAQGSDNRYNGSE